MTRTIAPVQEGEAASRRAKEICGYCPVRTKCLQDALRREDWHGVWGGTTGAERRGLVRQLKSQPALSA